MLNRDPCVGQLSLCYAARHGSVPLLRPYPCADCSCVRVCECVHLDQFFRDIVSGGAASAGGPGHGTAAGSGRAIVEVSYMSGSRGPRTVLVDVGGAGATAAVHWADVRAGACEKLHLRDPDAYVLLASDDADDILPLDATVDVGVQPHALLVPSLRGTRPLRGPPRRSPCRTSWLTRRLARGGARI